jgi:paired amphipathic helix protein Sin3a
VLPQTKKPKISHREASPSVDMDLQPQMPMAMAPPVVLPPGLSSIAGQSEVVFFERVKKAIDDKSTYNEFLKLLNLYVVDLIDQRELVRRAATFLGGDANELFHDFKKLVGFETSGIGNPNYPGTGVVAIDQNGMVDNVPMLERPKVDLNNQKAYGPSYRKLPRAEIQVSCSGRDPMCWEVLNDEWVSHPTWASEESTPVAAHKRNAYEEALHKTEEERHEYDYHIEANVRTIALLDPIATRIAHMDQQERENFKLKPGLGGQSKTIYQRILKKIYGRDAGQEVIAALHDQPALAVPVVLERLKRKDEEWKKAQREWNKVWREVDAKNFYKSLDHQGVVFKVNDKKAISTKTLIAEVEALRKEQTQKQAVMHDPSAVNARERGQYRFKVDDVDCLQDAVKLILSYLDRQTNSGTSERHRVEEFLRQFIPLFFQFTDVDFDAAFAEMDAAKADDDSDDGGSEGGRSHFEDEDGSSTTGKRGKKNGAADLRTNLLRGKVGERNGTRAGSATPSPAPQAPTAADGAAIAEEVPAPPPPPGEGPVVPGVSGMVAPDASERGETPVPPPADPVEVAEAVEKDNAEAEDGERTWVQLDGVSGSGTATPSVPPPPRRYNFFGNNSFFCFFRLLQVSRIWRLSSPENFY